uniref:Uncharacterized protein n=1 Tax=Romanomermis culicivorax TaxID=13658 RepID=A0A915KIQ9_ROMCU
MAQKNLGVCAKWHNPKTDANRMKRRIAGGCIDYFKMNWLGEQIEKKKVLTHDAHLLSAHIDFYGFIFIPRP